MKYRNGYYEVEDYRFSNGNHAVSFIDALAEARKSKTTLFVNRDQIARDHGGIRIDRTRRVSEIIGS